MDQDLGKRSLKSKYKIIARVGSGTYGVVYKAKALLTNQLVALKKFSTRAVDKSGVVSSEIEDFPITAIREIKLLKLLNHKNIISLWGVMPTKPSAKNGYCGSVYLVFEYMEHDLLGLITSRVIFSMSQIKCFLKQLLEGAIYLHQNKIIHRDLKSANILLNNKGEVKIADFGLSRQMSPNPEYTNKVVTLWYRAPELLLGSKDYTCQIDIWSIGCILAELFLGTVLFQESTEQKQLERIFEICGTPDKFTWPDAEKLCKFKELGPRIYRERRLKKYIREKKPELDELALDLLDKFLILDPKERITGIEALHHPFFKDNPVACSLEEMPKPRQECHETLVKKKGNEEDRSRNQPQRVPPIPQKFKDYRPPSIDPMQISQFLDPNFKFNLSASRLKPYIADVPWNSNPPLMPGLPRGISLMMNHPPQLPFNPPLGRVDYPPEAISHLHSRSESAEEPNSLRSLIRVTSKPEMDPSIRSLNYKGGGLVCLDAMNKKKISTIQIPDLTRAHSSISFREDKEQDRKLKEISAEKSKEVKFKQNDEEIKEINLKKITNKITEKRKIKKSLAKKGTDSTSKKAKATAKTVVIKDSDKDDDSNIFELDSQEKEEFKANEKNEKKTQIKAQKVENRAEVNKTLIEKSSIELEIINDAKKRGRGRKKKLQTKNYSEPVEKSEKESKNSTGNEKPVLNTGEAKLIDFTEQFQARTRHQKMELKGVLSELTVENKPKKNEREEIVKKPEEIVKKPEEIVKKPEEILKKSEEILKKSEETLKKPEEILKKPEEILKKPEENVKKPEENLKKPEESVRKPEENLKKTTEILKKSDEIGKKSGAVEEMNKKQEEIAKKVENEQPKPMNNSRPRGRPRKLNGKDRTDQQVTDTKIVEEVQTANIPQAKSDQKQNGKDQNDREPVQKKPETTEESKLKKLAQIMDEEDSVEFEIEEEEVDIGLEEVEKPSSPVVTQKRKKGRPPKDKNKLKKVKK